MRYFTVVLSMLVRQTVFAEATKAKDSDLALMEAKIYLASGEIEKARHLTEDVLATQNNNDEARVILSQIIDREIAQDREIPSPSTHVEELSAKDKQIETERWLERAQSFASFHQYEQAILSAEKVFLYSPHNEKASRLIDEVQRQALDEGVNGANSLNQSAKNEAKERIAQYRSQALQWMKEKRYGGARLALDKILLLDPANNEALQLKKQMRNLLENEKGKTL